jgi:electron transport complex protein RnfG
VKQDRAELLRIVACLAVVCALGAAVLGGVYVGTERYQRVAELRAEHDAIAEMLQLDTSATVLEVKQYLAPRPREVVYESAPFDGGEGPSNELVFTLDGRLVRRGGGVAAASRARRDWQPLGRIFVARRTGQLAGFVVEGLARGYKSRIRFLVALSPGFEIVGLRVVEHEEDPGLGAEVATRWFQGQFLGRRAADLPALDVTTRPMPEDWRSALGALARLPRDAWFQRFGALASRERGRPIYAVTGATISSRALTNGLRATVDHFRRRWELLEPYLVGNT